jgi:hypothetical protein
LDEADEHQFWDAVRSENARLNPEEREEYLHNGTLLDDLDDPEVKAISIRAGWCEDIRAISPDRLRHKFGEAEALVMARVETLPRRLLGL